MATIEQVLDRYRKTEDRSGEGRALNLYGIVLGRQGHLDQAISIFQQALALARELHDRRLEGMILHNLGIYPSDPAETYASFQRYLAISEEIGDLPGQRDAHSNLAELLVRFGRYREAEEHATQTIALSEHLNELRIRADALIVRGRVRQALGDLGPARAEITLGLGILQQLGLPLPIMWGLLDLSRLMLEDDQWQPALANLRQSYKLWEQLGQPYGADFAAPFFAMQARAELGLRHDSPAHALVRQALAALASEGSAGRVGWVDPSVEVLAQCYTVLADSGPVDQANTVLEQAHRRLEAVAERCGPLLRQTYLEAVDECVLIRAAWAIRPAAHDKTAKGAVTLRQAQVLLRIQDAQRRGETLDNEALARIFNTSSRTIQRDRNALSSAGYLP